jgi:hypothetical protein
VHGAVFAKPFAEFADMIQDSDDEYIVMLNNRHYVVVHGGMCFDNLFRNGQPLSTCRYRHLPITKVWRVLQLWCRIQSGLLRLSHIN